MNILSLTNYWQVFRHKIWIQNIPPFILAVLKQLARCSWQSKSKMQQNDARQLLDGHHVPVRGLLWFYLAFPFNLPQKIPSQKIYISMLILALGLHIYSFPSCSLLHTLRNHGSSCQNERQNGTLVKRTENKDHVR